MKPLEPYYAINRATGISVTLLDDGGISLQGCQVQVKDQQLHLEKKVMAIPGTEGLARHFDQKLPIALNLSGRGVMYKQLAGVDEIGTAEFAQLLPDADMEHFYIQHFRSADVSFVAIIRRADADGWIDRVEQAGYRVFMLCLGPFPLLHILPQLNIYNEEIIFNGHRIIRNEALQWISYEYTEGEGSAPYPIKLDNEQIDETLLTAYAAVFQLVLSLKLDPVKAIVERLETVYEQDLEIRRFKAKGFIVLLACLLLLLGNFLTYSWLENKNEALSMRVSSSEMTSGVRQQLSRRVHRKKALLRELGWDGGMRKSVWVDDMASLLPDDISWQQVSVNPIDERESRNRRSLLFSERRMEIKGFSPRIIPVNEWIARIKSRGWVKSVQLSSFNYNHELNTGEFTLYIIY